MSIQLNVVMGKTKGLLRGGRKGKRERERSTCGHGIV